MPIIRSIQDLDSLPRDRRVNGLLTRDRVAFEIPNLARRDQIRWEKVLNRYQSRCGCVAGAVCSLLTLMVGGASLVSSDHTVFSLEFFGRAVMIFLVALILGLLSKLIALEITRAQFARSCGRLREEVFGRQNEGRERIAWEG